MQNLSLIHILDEDSKLVLKNVSQGISNYANVALEESLGTIRGFLPKDFSIANRKRNPADVDYRNTIVDADGQIAQNVELRYRKMTDADLSATLNPTTYTYDEMCIRDSCKPGAAGYCITFS